MGSIMRNGSHVVGAKSMMHIWTTTIDKTRLAESSLYKLNIDEEADDINLQWELDVVKVCTTYPGHTHIDIAKGHNARIVYGFSTGNTGYLNSGLPKNLVLLFFCR